MTCTCHIILPICYQLTESVLKTGLAQKRFKQSSKALFLIKIIVAVQLPALVANSAFAIQSRQDKDKDL